MLNKVGQFIGYVLVGALGIGALGLLALAVKFFIGIF